MAVRLFPSSPTGISRHRITPPFGRLADLAQKIVTTPTANYCAPDYVIDGGTRALNAGGAGACALTTSASDMPAADV